MKETQKLAEKKLEVSFSELTFSLKNLEKVKSDIELELNNKNTGNEISYLAIKLELYALERT